MTSSKPYLVRALYEWIVDNSLTPHLLVDACHEQAVVPMRYVENGKIVLNVSPSAVQGLDLGNNEISFSARFGSQEASVIVPVEAIIAVYARENGQGMVLTFDETDLPPDGPASSPDPEQIGKTGRPVVKRPVLRRVK